MDFLRFAFRGVARLSFPARIGRAPFYSARSASKKDGLAPSLLFFCDPALPSFKGWPGLVPYCARRTTTVSSWGFREHGEPTRPSLSPS